MRTRLRIFFALLLFFVFGLSNVFTVTSKAHSKNFAKTSGVNPTTNLARRKARQEKSWLNLKNGREISAGITDAGDSDLLLRSGQARPLSIDYGDFDADGAPDLVVGYAAAGRGIVSLTRGNLEAFAPQSEPAFRAIQKGRMPASFLNAAQKWEVPEQPDFLAVGDFNRDGFQDVLAGARGGGLYLLAGNGTGDFAAAERINLSGAVTTLTVGSFNHASKFSSAAVGVEDGEGAAVLIFENGFRDAPVKYNLPAAATSAVFGKLDTDSYYDLAVAAGNEVEIIHGGQSEKAIYESENSVSQSRVEHIGLPFAAAISLGEYIWNRDDRSQLAVLATDGTVQVIQPADLDTRPFTPEEQAKRVAEGQRDLPVSPEESEQLNARLWQPNAEAGWTVGNQLFTGSASDGNLIQSRLVTAHLSYQSTEDLMILDANQRQVSIVKNLGNQSAGDSEQSVVSLNPQTAPVAVLEMPRKANGERDIVILNQDSINPLTIIAAPTATITVDRTDDTASASACTAAANDCSLRGAVIFANANPGTTVNVPAGTYQLTIADTTNAGVNAGDLDFIASGTSVVGAGAATTIIQQKTADRVLKFNPGASASNWTGSLSGLTVRGGNVPSGGAPDGRFGGGGLLCGGINNTVTIVSSVFDGNTNNSSIAGNGAGVDQAPSSGSNDVGSLTVTNTTFSNNTTASGVGGGYAFRPAVSGSVNMTSCAFTGNQATTNSGGGASLHGNGTAPTFTFSKSTFTGNKALGASGSSVGGAIDETNGALTMNYSRIVGNTANAPGINPGSGYYISGNGTNNVTENWWGCNADPTTQPAGCDSVSISQPVAAGNATTVNPRLQLTHTAGTNPIVTGQSTTLTASFLKDSNGNAVAAGNLGVLIGLPVMFSNPVKGNLSSAQTTIQSTATASATFTASAAGAGSADAKVDNQTTTASITINKANTTTTITNNPATTVVGQSYTVNFSVAVTAPGSGSPTTPTGNVIVSDGSQSCSGAVSAAGTGSCVLTSTSAGSKTLTATYQGDSNFNSSPASAGAAHTVNAGSTTTSVSSSLNPSAAGQSVNFTATVGIVSPAAGTPTGTVQFIVDGSNFGAPVTLSGGTAVLTNITSLTAGNHTVAANYSGDNNFNSSSGSITGGQTVIAPPLISKAFTPASIGLKGNSTLTVTITNPSVNAVSLTGVGVSDSFPAGMEVDAAPLTTNSCSTGIFAPVAAATSISISGATIPASTACTFSVQVKGTSFGDKVNTTGAVTSSNGGTGGTASATLSVVTLEADVTPRSTGDGNVDATDLQQIERFSVGFDKPYQLNEGQRADCAPRTDSNGNVVGGDGQVDATDVQQAERYSIGLDPKTPASGPTSVSRPQPAAKLGQTNLRDAPAAPRTLSVQSVNTSQGQSVTVNILDDAAGDEAGYTFSISYDQMILSNPVITKGTITGETVLTNATTAGQIGFSVRFGGGTIPMGNGQVLLSITFTVASNAPFGQTPINFTSTPAPQGTSDANAQPLATNYTNGTVTVTQPTAATVSVGGRVLSPTGTGIANAVVRLSSQSGAIQTTRTNYLGYYEFRELAAGETYIFDVYAKNYRFDTRVITLTEDSSELNFTAARGSGKVNQELKLRDKKL